ncbi:negative regulation of histone ubiquitination [Fragilaria crotonensis]|nr:negative regulation of histone ubiquitination [Fragilaria crotonensis]
MARRSNLVTVWPTENASLFNPHWEAPINLGMHRTENCLIVGDEFLNIATLPVGASEGKSIRTAQHIPSVNTLSNGRPLRRKAIGFRVAIKRPFRETGKSLGGGYLVGVTTSSFSSFDERNSLQQSSLFWGIDDNGNKYEGGSTDTISMRGSQRPHHGVGHGLKPDKFTKFYGTAVKFGHGVAISWMAV